MKLERQRLIISILVSGKYTLVYGGGQDQTVLTHKGKFLRPRVMNNDMLSYRIRGSSGPAINVYAHTLFYLAVNGTFYPGMKVVHKNKDVKDNRLSNLELVRDTMNTMKGFDKGEFKVKKQKKQKASSSGPGRLIKEWAERNGRKLESF